MMVEKNNNFRDRHIATRAWKFDVWVAHSSMLIHLLMIRNQQSLVSKKKLSTPHFLNPDNLLSNVEEDQYSTISIYCSSLKSFIWFWSGSSLREDSVSLELDADPVLENRNRALLALSSFQQNASYKELM